MLAATVMFGGGLGVIVQVRREGGRGKARTTTLDADAGGHCNLIFLGEIGAGREGGRDAR